MRVRFGLSILLILLSFAVNAQEQPNQRIVALAPHIVESLFAIGAGDRIIATTDHADYPNAAKDIPQVGNYARLQIERIVELQPDLVIGWKTGNPIEDLERLEKYGLKVVYSNPSQLEDVATELRFYGELTGLTEQANALAESYLSRLHTLKRKYNDATPVVTFYEMWARPLRTVAKKAWLQQQIVLCGAQNPFSDLAEDYPLISLEQVLASNPQVVIQPSPHSASSPDALNWQQWQHIPAAKHGFVFHPNADKTHRMTMRMLDELELLCQNIDSAREFYISNSD